MEDENIEIGKA